jgi:hypothetical protein
MQNLPARVKLQWRRIFLETVKNADFPAAQKKNGQSFIGLLFTVKPVLTVINSQTCVNCY